VTSQTHHNIGQKTFEVCLAATSILDYKVISGWTRVMYLWS